MVPQILTSGIRVMPPNLVVCVGDVRSPRVQKGAVKPM